MASRTTAPVRSDRPSMACGVRRTLDASTPNVGAGEEGDPHHVDEVPVPGRELETQVLRRREMAEIGADQAYDQERRPNDHVRPVKAGGHEEGGTVDVAAEIERRVAVFISLHAGERQ